MRQPYTLLPIRIVALVAMLVSLAQSFAAQSTAAQVGSAQQPSPTAKPSPAQPATTGHLSFATTIQPFLNAYCVGCHGGKQQKGERRFDQLDPDLPDDNALVDFQDILDQLNLGEMPPAKAKQPSDQQRRMVTDWLVARIARHHREQPAHPSQTVLRRLNAREYRNTVRDLLHLEMTMFDPTAHFPLDRTVDHLDNIGASLVMSGHLLDRYLEAADRVINKALLPLQKPPVQKWAFRDNFRQQPEIDQVHGKTNRFRHMTLYDVVGADKHEGAYGPILAFKQGVPFDGLYELRIKAEAVNRQHPYDPAFLGLDPTQPLRLGIVPGDHRVGRLHLPQPVEPLLVEIDLADESKWYTVRVWLDAGYTPRFTFRNGLMDVRSLWSRLLRKYPDQFPKRKNNGIVEARFNAIKFGKLPQIHIHEIEIEGPLLPAWPTPSQQALLGDQGKAILQSGSLTKDQTRVLLRSFLSRAYRRPAREEDVARIMQVIQTRQQSGRTSLEAYADGLKAALCSPHFVYLDEGPTRDEGQGRDKLAAEAVTVRAGRGTPQPTTPSSTAPPSRLLNSTALASRLSYFLWSSMPDQVLMDLAVSGELDQPAVLAAQVERMLRDPKSAAFVDGFLGSWLTLRKLGETAPDRSQFGAFYRSNLDHAMRRESHLFLRHMIDANLGLATFLDADFAFVNPALAKLYDVPAPRGNGFEKVTLTDGRRGGLLGQASVLTVTANGIDTSPVVRGVWILENILGTPPSPPPPDVEPLDPDIRGAKTIRDQLRKHRDVASCNDCHRKIDPLGFALENFDPIGKWRDAYGRNKPIDASGQLPGGESFDDIVGLKRILRSHQNQFVRSLTEKLLAYGMGRQLRAADRPALDAILAMAHDGGFRDLLHQVVASELFRSR